MRKNIIKLISIALIASVMLCACGNNTNDISKQKVEKYVELCDYTNGFDIQVEDAVRMSDEELEMYINYYLNYATYVATEADMIKDRPVKNGDLINLDYKGFKDGVAFEGGEAAGYDLEIGSGSFIPGFEEQLVGANPGDNFDITVTFPKEYAAKELAGAETVFNITVNYIYADDYNDKRAASLAESLGTTDVTDIESLGTFISDIVYQNSVNQYEQNVQYEIMNALSAQSTFKALPKKVVAIFETSISKSLEAAATSNGTDVDTYCTDNYGSTAAEIVEKYAEDTAREYVAAQVVANEQGLNPTDEELDEYINNDAETYGYEDAEAFMKDCGFTREDAKNDLMFGNVVDYLRSISRISAN